MKFKYFIIPAVLLLVGAGCTETPNSGAVNQLAVQPNVQQQTAPTFELYKNSVFGFVIKTNTAACQKNIKIVEDQANKATFRVTVPNDQMWTGDWYSYGVVKKIEYDAAVKANGDAPGGPGSVVATLKNGNVLVVVSPQDFPITVTGCETSAEAI